MKKPFPWKMLWCFFGLHKKGDKGWHDVHGWSEICPECKRIKKYLPPNK